MSIRTIKMEDLSHDPKLQMRTKQDEDAIWEYAENLDKLPPMKVVLDQDGKYWPYDGWHTYEARRRKKCDSIQCHVTEGTYRDAVLLAAGANHCHGIRRTSDDKTKAVTILLQDSEWSLKSNNWVADQCHVSDYLVKRIRETLNPQGNGSQDDMSGSKSGTCQSYEQSKTNSSPSSNGTGHQKQTISTKRTGKDGKQYSTTRPKSEQKSGRLKFDDRKVEEMVGKLTRLFNDRAQALGHQKHEGWKLTHKKMSELIEAWEAWQRA